MASRRPKRFATRLLLNFGLLWSIFWLAGAAAGYLTVEKGLKSRLEVLLISDVARVAAFYRQGELGQVAATGGASIVLYDYSGNAVVPEDPPFTLPAEVVTRASPTPRIYEASEFTAAYADAGVGVIAVIQGTGFIKALAYQTAKALSLFFLAGLVLGLAAIYGLSRRITGPLVAAAREVAARKADDLAPITYDGPDDELALIVHHFNHLLGELKAAKAKERDFLNEVAHELNTPLAVLTAQLERGDLASAKRTTRHLARLTADLLALARGEPERDLDPHIVDLRDLVREAAAEHPGIRVDLPQEAVETLGDPDRLLQLVRNLLANAVRAAGASGVEVGVRAGTDEVRLWVRDSGPGIPEELLERIFDRYVKGKAGRRGLGLAIAKQIVEAHGGEIGVRSQPGNTVFEVRLPGLEED